MRTTNLVKVVFALIVGLGLTMASCKKDEEQTEENPHNDAYADVFVKKINTPNGVKYGLVFYAGGEGLTDCKATAPNGTEFTLGDYWKGAGNLRLHPTMPQMQNTMPEAGDYVFTMTFDDGVTKDVTDALSNIEIPAMSGVAGTHASGTENVSVDWNAIADADNYMIKLTDEQKNQSKPIFVSILPPNVTTYSFDRTTTANPGWLQTDKPQADDNTFLFVVGVKYEAGVSGADRMNNKQMVTAQPANFVW